MYFPRLSLVGIKREGVLAHLSQCNACRAQLEWEHSLLADCGPAN